MIIKMAWRNVWRNKLRSSIIIFSVSIGLFAGIAVLALYEGMLYGRTRTVIYAEVGHIQIHDTDFKKDYASEYFLQKPEKVIAAVRSIPKIKKFTLRSIVQGLLTTATGSAGVQINGVQTNDEYQVSGLNKKIIEGKVFDTSKKNQIIIGKKLSDKMKLKNGAKLVLTFTDKSSSIVSGAFRVVGIYQSENSPLDELNVYVLRKDLNQMLGIDNNYHELAMLLYNDKDLLYVQTQLKKILPNHLIENWRQISPESELMIKTVDSYSYVIIVIIMFALAFGIINTMMMSVLERTREIGMMMAIGLSRIGMIFLVFLETMLLTIIGVPVGLGIGWIVINYFNKKGLDLSGMGKDLMSSFGYSTIIYPEFPFDKLIGVITIVIVVAILSCLMPVIKTLKLRPVVALRN